MFGNLSMSVNPTMCKENGGKPLLRPYEEECE